MKMENDGDSLLGAMRHLGFDLMRMTEQTNPELFKDPKPLLVAVIFGGLLDGTHAFLTAKGDVCKVAIWLELSDGKNPIGEDQRAKLFERFLALNYSIPFGRVSMASYSIDGFPHKAIIVFAETMFFWRSAKSPCKDLFDTEVATRLQELVKLYAAVKAEISAIMPS